MPEFRQSRPLAAFIAGRARLRERERTDRIDTANLQTQTLGDNLRRLQISDLAGKPGRERQEREAQAAQRKQLFDQIGNLDIDDQAKRAAQSAVLSGNEKDAFDLIQDQLKPQRAPLVTIKNPAVETAADKEFGKTVGERASKRIQEAQATVPVDNDLGRVLLALDRGAQTGLGEETILNLKSLGNTLFGIEFSDADREAEVVRKIGNEAALRLRNPDSGLGLTGSTSNRDLEFLKASVVNLQKQEGGNRAIIDYTLRLNQMKRDIAAEQARVISEVGRIPADLDTRLSRFADNYEFFTPQERQELESIASQPQSLLDRATPQERVEDLPGFEDLTPEEQEELRRLDRISGGNR